MSGGTKDCHACGGDGWLPSKPEGKSDCPYCMGSGKISAYPIKLRVSAAALDELSTTEEGSYEDASNELAKAGDSEQLIAMKLSRHAHKVAQRHRTVLEIVDADEAEAVYYAVCSGTFQLTRLRLARRIADALRPHVKPETARRWPAPSGH